jgi:ATP-dependent DNA helicase PIF1
MQTVTNDQVNLDFNGRFKEAYDLLEHSHKNVFITGKAGTGKSTLLKYFRDNTRKNVVALAPTGVAAVNVKGQTIHSFFRFKPDITPDSVRSIRIRKSKREIYEKIDALVIDEISMVRADLLDCVDGFLRLHGKEKNSPFGGIQIIFFGDLFQLPPVVTAPEQVIFTEVYTSPYFFAAKSFEHLDVHFIELDKIYRQKEEDFVRLLSSIRNKSATDEHLEILNKRYIPNFRPNRDDFYIFLTTTNILADRINQDQLRELETDACHYEGQRTGQFNLKNLPTQESLDLKVGAQVMLLNNDPAGRWINGSIGKIISFLEDCETIIVELSEGQRVEVTPYTWEMFQYFYNEETAMLDSESIGSFRQFPLRLAWAVTIHKSQGKTFSKVVLDIGNGTFSHGQTYVALSRCTNIQGLVLKKPIRQKHILLDSRVVAFMHSKLTAS